MINNIMEIIHHPGQKIVAGDWNELIKVQWFQNIPEVIYHLRVNKYISDLWILSHKGVMFRKSTISINVILVERLCL